MLTAAADMLNVATEGMNAGLENNYLPPDDDRVLAATEIIGGGESTTISFPGNLVSPDGEYMFFCSYPGHWAIMQGSFAINSP